MVNKELLVPKISSDKLLFTNYLLFQLIIGLAYLLLICFWFHQTQRDEKTVLSLKGNLSIEKKACS